MRQLLHNFKTGETTQLDVPKPGLKTGHIMVQTSISMISAGTERMLVEFGKAGLIGKARSQPEKVKQVIEKVKTDGLATTINAVRAKLDQPLALGYCNVGKILEVGSDVTAGSGFTSGTRVASNGAHAEIVCVGKNLCARIPDIVSDEEAAFTVVGAIGLQGIRLAQPTLGERFVVTGLGLIGQITAQLLISHGCSVLGIDIDQGKCDLARQFGVEVLNISSGQDPIDAALSFSKGRGVDGVLVTASTKSSEPIHQAAHMCRKRGRIVLIGVSGLELNRADFYEKELSFQVSCSYGPGRYDANYEEKGQDYPIGFVRWTEQRNFEAILDMMASGRLNVKPLITHRFPFTEAQKAYDLITENKAPHLGILLTYADVPPNQDRTIQLARTVSAAINEGVLPTIGLVGAGNFTRQVLLPAIAKTGIRLKTIASGSGVTGTHSGKKFNIENSTTDTEIIFNDNEINTVFITTRHNSHAAFALRAIESGKHVFVEKPLCLTIEHLEEIRHRYEKASVKRPLLLVGFNRRFAPHIMKMKELLSACTGPKSMIMTVNAGAVPADHWIQDAIVGGGRIIGEACHFIDLLRFIAGAKIISHRINAIPNQYRDTASIQLSFEDGSIGTVHYFANGSKAYPKERLEVFCQGRILQMNNYLTLYGYGWRSFKKMRLWNQDKGHVAEVRAFVNAIKNGLEAPIPFEEIEEVSRVAIELAVA